MMTTDSLRRCEIRSIFGPMSLTRPSISSAIFESLLSSSALDRSSVLILIFRWRLLERQHAYPVADRIFDLFGRSSLEKTGNVDLELVVLDQ